MMDLSESIAQPATVELIDYPVRRLPTEADLVAADGSERLRWQAPEPAGAEAATAFAFKPQYSYERDAVARDGGSLYERHGDWWRYTGDNPAIDLARLLDDTIWQGRPLLGAQADYWVPLDLSDRGTLYRGLLTACRRQLAAGASVPPVIDPREPDQPDHNLEPAVRRLLQLTDEQGRELAFEWPVKPDRLISQPLAPDKDGNAAAPLALNLLTGGVVRCWFMPGGTLLIQWRLTASLPLPTAALAKSLDWNDGPDASKRVAAHWLSLLDNGVDHPGGHLPFDHWLRLVQALRWEKIAFAAAVDEGRAFAGTVAVLPALLVEAVAGEAPLSEDMQGLQPLVGAAADDRSTRDPRRFTSLLAAPMSMDPASRFNGALDRAWSHLLGIDTPFVVNRQCDNFAFDPPFLADWVRDRSYLRWDATGLRYGFSDYSAVAMGTGSFFRAQVQGYDWPGLYAELTRLVLYQRSRLRAFAADFCTPPNRIDTYKGQLHWQRDMRQKLQQFNRESWFDEVSAQLQPGELNRLQRRAMRLDAQLADVRAEFDDSRSYLEALAAERDRWQGWVLAGLGLLIAVPGFLAVWGAGSKAEDVFEGGGLMPFWTAVCLAVSDPHFFVPLGLAVVLWLFWPRIERRTGLIGWMGRTWRDLLAWRKG